QGHFGEGSPLALGGIADRAQITLVQMFQARQNGTHPLPFGIQIVLDLDNRRDGVTSLTKKLQTDRACMRGHAMQYPPRRGDQAVAPFFLNARQACQKLVSDVLSKARLTKTGAFNNEGFAAQGSGSRRRGTIKPLKLESRLRGVVNLAQI